MGDRESTLCPAQQTHSSCGPSRGMDPSYCTRCSSDSSSSLPRLESLTSPTTTDPPKAPSAATVAPSQRRERESLNNWSRQNSSSKRRMFLLLPMLLKLTAVTKNHCYPHILEPQMSGRCNSSSSVQVGNTRILVGIFTEIPQLSLPRGIKKDFTRCNYL